MSSSKDTEMKPAEETKQEVSKESEPVKISPKQVLLKDLRENITMLAEGTQTKERRIVARVLMLTTAQRKNLSLDVLINIAKQYYPEALVQLAKVEDKLPKDESEPLVDVPPTPLPPSSNVAPTSIPEVKVYVLQLVTYFVMDKGLNQEAAECARVLVDLLHSFNQRTMDQLSAKVYTSWSLACERVGQDAAIRSELLNYHRIACINHNAPGQGALVNAILRSFVNHRMYDQAEKFLLNSTFPDKHVTNNQHARFLYYTAKIQSVQLRYSDSYRSVSQALRKAPQRLALGFRQKATKLQVVVQLLMGEIPDRSTFLPLDLQPSLQPYLELTRAVRVGDLAIFSDVLAKYKADFVRDDLFSLVTRLRANVIKIGLRKVNSSYSRISIQDICNKLKLSGVEDGEYIVSKAIHDGVIEAVINREEHYLFSKENTDIYSTQDPLNAFHKRIQFCMEIHDEAVKALQYPPNAGKIKTDLEQLELDEEEEIAEAEKDKGMGLDNNEGH